MNICSIRRKYYIRLCKANQLDKYMYIRKQTLQLLTIVHVA